MTASQRLGRAASAVAVVGVLAGGCDGVEVALPFDLDGLAFDGLGLDHDDGPLRACWPGEVPGSVECTFFDCVADDTGVSCPDLLAGNWIWFEDGACAPGWHR